MWKEFIDRSKNTYVSNVITSILVTQKKGRQKKKYGNGYRRNSRISRSKNKTKNLGRASPNEFPVLLNIYKVIYLSSGYYQLTNQYQLAFVFLSRLDEVMTGSTTEQQQNPREQEHEVKGDSYFPAREELYHGFY